MVRQLLTTLLLSLLALGATLVDVSAQTTAPPPAQAAPPATQQPPVIKEPVFMKLIATPQTAYVQQQIIVTLEVWMHQNFEVGGNLGAPTANLDISLQRLGQPRKLTKTHQGQPYNIHEDRFILHPRQSGTLRIAPIVLSNGHYVDIRQRRRIPIRAQSNELQITVRPIPASFPGITWLPATAMRLSESWSDNPTNVRAGTPITRTVTLLADGLNASQLPDIQYPEIPDVRIYPEKKKTQDISAAGRSQSIQKTVLIPTEPGQFTLPAIRIPWWNVNTDRLEYAELPAKVFDIREAPKDLLVSSEPLNTQITETSADTSSNPWLWISVLLFIAWVATSVVLLQRMKASSTSEQEQQRQQQKVQSLSKARKRLQRSCADNDSHASKQALLDWAQLLWETPAMNTLGELAQRVGDEHLVDEIRKLNRVLYSDDSQWQGQSLWVLFEAFDAKRAQTSEDKAPAPALESLHRLS